MERLTGRDKSGFAHYKQCFEEPCLGCGCEIEDCRYKQQYCETLAAYEETELTPEECVALKAENERIRQESVSHAVFTDLLTKYEKLKEVVENGASKY